MKNSRSIALQSYCFNTPYSMAFAIYHDLLLLQNRLFAIKRARRNRTVLPHSSFLIDMPPHPLAPAPGSASKLWTTLRRKSGYLSGAVAPPAVAFHAPFLLTLWRFGKPRGAPRFCCLKPPENKGVCPFRREMNEQCGLFEPTSPRPLLKTHRYPRFFPQAFHRENAARKLKNTLFHGFHSPYYYD